MELPATVRESARQNGAAWAHPRSTPPRLSTMMKFENPAALTLYRAIRNRVTQQASEQPRTDSTDNLTELVLNIAKGCNLDCPYSFANAGLYSGEKSSWMTKSDAYTFTLEMLNAHPKIHRIKLFGGEPFMNVPAMEGCAEAVKRYRAEASVPTGQLSIGCVTNMTIYSERITELARQMNLQITASVDGPIEIHDKNRRFRNGRGSYNRIKKNIKSYRDAGVAIAGMECVYSPEHMESGVSILALHNFLLDEFSAPRIIITPIQGAFEDKGEEAEFVRWIRTCAEEYLREAVRLREQHDSYKAVMDEQTRVVFTDLQDLGWCGLGTTTLTVDVDGAVLPCYTSLYEKDGWRMGSLSKLGYEDEEASTKIGIKLREANPRIARSCSSCDIRDVCRGCPGGVYAANGKFTGVDPVGCAYRIGALEGLLNGWQNETRSN